jgi:predicted flap endonuclease-1-like 5' DNA nuclease
MSWWVWVLIVLVIILLLLLLWWLLIRRRRSMSPGPMAVPKAQTSASQSTPPAGMPRAGEPMPASAVATTQMEATQPAEPVAPDDLAVIEGIGPRIAAVLNAAGITTFSQLAATDVGRLQELMRNAGLRIAAPGTWPEQAALAAAGQWQELKTLQGQLKGGRQV